MKRIWYRVVVPRVQYRGGVREILPARVCCRESAVSPSGGKEESFFAQGLLSDYYLLLRS